MLPRVAQIPISPLPSVAGPELDHPDFPQKQTVTACLVPSRTYYSTVTAPPVPSLPNHCPPVLPPHIPPPDHPSCSVVYRGSGGFGGSGDRGNRGPESTRASAWNVGERSTVEGGGEFVKDRGSLKTFALGVGARNCCPHPQLDLRSALLTLRPPPHAPRPCQSFAAARIPARRGLD